MVALPEIDARTSSHYARPKSMAVQGPSRTDDVYTIPSCRDLQALAIPLKEENLSGGRRGCQNMAEDLVPCWWTPGFTQVTDIRINVRPGPFSVRT